MKEIDRNYRLITKQDLKYFNICIFESDINIGIESTLSDEEKILIEKASLKLLRSLREALFKINEQYTEFFKSLTPLRIQPNLSDNDYTLPQRTLIQGMLNASIITGVGPMAAVAGGISQIIGQMISKYTNNFIIENGGDIFLSSNTDRILKVYAGESVLSNKIGIKIKPEQMPIGICTSSGTVGRSLSFGKADAVVVTSKNTFIADATATYLGNIIKNKTNIEEALKAAKKILEISGVFIIIEEQVGAYGEIEILEVGS